MPGRNEQPGVCTDAEWKGRPDCALCGIRRVMLFSGLPASGFEHLLRPIDNFVYRPGSTIYQEGAQGRAVFSIRRGLVKLLYRTPDGSQRIVRLLGKGAVAGLELLDEGVTYHHTAVTVQEVDLCTIPVATLKDLEAQHPELCDRVRQQLQYQVDRADHWIRALNTGIARTRIAQLLLLLAEIAADRNGDIQLLPRDDMAAVVGVTTETASRVIADFKRRNVIYKVAANTYRIEPAKLREFGTQEQHTD
ncbi:MAG: Crp/Fnr family transcriptional regulator [Pseudomonadota bacterium]